MLRETTNKQAQSARRGGGAAVESFESFLAAITGQTDESDANVFNRGKDMHSASLGNKTPQRQAHDMQMASRANVPRINQGPPTPQYMQNSRTPTSDAMLQDEAMELTYAGSAGINPQQYQAAAGRMLGSGTRPVETQITSRGLKDASFAYAPNNSVTGGRIQMSQAPSTANIDALRAALEAAIADRDAKMSGRQGGDAKMWENVREQSYNAGTRNR